MLFHFRADPPAETQQIAARALAIDLDAMQDLLFRLRAHARQFPQLVLAGQQFQFIDGRGAEVLP